MPADLADDLRARCLAALSSSPANTFVTLFTAGTLQRLWLPQVDGAIHLATVTCDRQSESMTRTRRRQFVTHRREIPEQDLTVLDGVAMTTVPRTWLDLAAVLSLPDLVAAGDSALRGGSTREELSEIVRLASGRRGIRTARAALELLDARSRSRPESHVRVAISSTGMPLFAVNGPVHRREGGWLAEPDLSLAEARIAIEYQGSDHGTVERLRKDLTRAADLRREGWEVFAYGPAETFGRPWEIESEIRRAIRRRAPHLLIKSG